MPTTAIAVTTRPLRTAVRIDDSSFSDRRLDHSRSLGQPANAAPTWRQRRPASLASVPPLRWAAARSSSSGSADRSRSCGTAARGAASAEAARTPRDAAAQRGPDRLDRPADRRRVGARAAEDGAAGAAGAGCRPAQGARRRGDRDAGAGLRPRARRRTPRPARFERLVEDGRAARAAGNPERGAALLREALELWRGPPFADFSYKEFAQPAIARLEELRLAAIEERIEADLALGRDAEVTASSSRSSPSIPCASGRAGS